MDIGSLHFIRPAWLLLLPVCLFLPWAWRRWRQPTGDWAAVCDPHLLRWLAVGESGPGRGGAGGWLAGLGLLLATLAMSGPSWERLPDAGFSATDARIIAVDLSQSMLAQDLRPDRLTRARFRLSDLLAATEEGQVGLVAYAGDAYVVAPLTGDTNTIINMLPALRPDVVPVSGSRADRALELGAELLTRTGLGRGEILLVTDNADPRAIDMADQLAGDGITTSVLAVGSEEGAPIPSGNGFLADAGGNIVIARMDEAPLRALAEAGRGRYTALATQADATPWAIGEGDSFTRREDGAGARWRDFGPWLLLGLLPLAAVGFRRGWLFNHAAMAPVAGLLAVTLAAVPGESHAGAWDDLWQRKDQQAQEALAEGRATEAAALAKDPAIAAEARFRDGDYAGAAGRWSALDDASAQYNQGNALAHSGRLEEALSAYDRALELNPDMEDALANRAVVEQALQQQQSENSSGEGEQDQGDPQSSEQEGEQDQQQQGDAESEGEPGESEDSESGEQDANRAGEEEAMAQAWSEEDEQAMEQWLRRIPDDPGGLLRRKFQLEHQRRGAPPEEGEPW